MGSVATQPGPQTETILERRSPGSYTDLIQYNVTDHAIAELKGRYLSLAVSGVADKQGYELCRRARIEVKNLRCEVEKRRKELKADSLEFGRAVDREAKRIIDQLEPIENHLARQQQIVDDEKKRLEEEAARKKRELATLRAETLGRFGVWMNLQVVEAWSEDQYQSILTKAKEDHEAKEAERKAKEEELAKLKAERDEQDRKLKEQEEANRLLKEEQEKRLKAERDEQERKLKEEQEKVQKLKDELLAKQQADLEREQKERLAAEQREAEAKVKEKAERDAKELAQKQALEAQKKAEEDQRKAVADAEAKAKREQEEADRKRKEEEEAKRKEEERLRLEAEAKAAQEIADRKLFDYIKTKFPTVELAWAEIGRLMKQLHELPK